MPAVDAIDGLDNHHVLLFVSSLATGASDDAVVTIAKQATRNNERNGITGLLVFDGNRFAQLMEGPLDAVTKIATLMRTDRRHTEMEILHAASVQAPRRFPQWRLGYLVMDLQEFGLQSLRGQRGAQAMESFYFMLPALDIAVGDAVPQTLSGLR